MNAETHAENQRAALDKLQRKHNTLRGHMRVLQAQLRQAQERERVLEIALRLVEYAHGRCGDCGCEPGGVDGELSVHEDDCVVGAALAGVSLTYAEALAATQPSEPEAGEGEA